MLLGVLAVGYTSRWAVAGVFHSRLLWQMLLLFVQHQLVHGTMLPIL